MNKTRLSCLVRVGGVNTIADKTRQFGVVSTQFPISKFSVIFNIFETEQLQTENRLVLSAIVSTLPTRTKQDSFVLICLWCEQAIRNYIATHTKLITETDRYSSVHLEALMIHMVTSQSTKYNTRKQSSNRVQTSSANADLPTY